MKRQADQAMVDLWTVCADLGDEEKRAVLFLAKRILMGQRQYGVLDLRNDARDWRRERAHEFADALIYESYREVAEMLRGEK